MADINKYGGKVTVTATTAPIGHIIETLQSSNLPEWVSDVMTGATWSGNVAPNETTSERSFRLNVKVSTNHDSQYQGVASIQCGWTVTQEGQETPPPTPTQGPCTFTFRLDGDSYIKNDSQSNVVLYDYGHDDSFTMVASNGEGSSVNTGFEATSAPPMQTSNIFVTKASEVFEIEFNGNETTKEMQVRYDFFGDLGNATKVSMKATFKNLTTQTEDKILTIHEGSGYYQYLDLDDWYVSNGDVEIQASFEIDVV